MSPNTIPQGNYKNNERNSAATWQMYPPWDGELEAPIPSISQSWHDWPVAWRDAEGDVVMVDYEDGDVVMCDLDGQVVMF